MVKRNQLYPFNHISIEEIEMNGVEGMPFSLSPIDYIRKGMSSSPEVTLDSSTLSPKVESRYIESVESSHEDGHQIGNGGDKGVESRLPKMGLKYIPEQRMQLARKNGARYTFMVTGSSGTGKSTFINTLFQDSIVPIEENHVSRRGSALDPIKVYRAELTEDLFTLKLTIIDTPGFGESIDNQFSWSPAEKFIDEQFRLHMYQEEQPNRSKLFDSRVHCCFYFIQPTGKGLSKLDIATMKALGQRTNLIPIVARSDTFTTTGLKSFKELVKSTMMRENINVCDFILDQSVHEKINEVMPFAIIGATGELYQTSDGRKVRGRKYDWGIAETDNPSHCDFSSLREIFMGENMLDLILSTETHYENFRKRCLIERFNEVRKLDSAVEKEYAQYSSNHPFNGLEEFKIFHKFKLKQLEAKIQESDSIYKAKEKEAKNKFGQVVQLQEKRFREWKKVLIARQDEYNREIESLHLKIIRMQDANQLLESGSDLLEESYKSLSLS